MFLSGEFILEVLIINSLVNCPEFECTTYPHDLKGCIFAVKHPSMSYITSGYFDLWSGYWLREYCVTFLFLYNVSSKYFKELYMFLNKSIFLKFRLCRLICDNVHIVYFLLSAFVMSMSAFTSSSTKKYGI